MSNPIVPPLPLPDDDRVPDADRVSDPATVEAEGERVLDPDLDPDQVDSAAADRLAAEQEPDDEGVSS